MSKEKELTRINKGIANFNLVGRAKVSDFTCKRDVESSKSDWIYNQLNLGIECGEKMNFKDQGIDEKEWLSKVEELSYLAYEDQCTPANPRMPMVHDMEAILRVIYDYESKF